MKTASSYPRGENHPRAKVDDHDVALAIELVEVYGLTAAEVGRKFGVTGRAVLYWVAAARRNSLMADVE